MAKTKDFLLKYGVKPSKQVQPTDPDDLYGGGTLVSLGANNQVRFDELEIIDTPEQFVDNASNDSIFEVGQEPSAVPCSVSGKMKFYTQGCEDVLIGCFGYEDLDGPINYGTTEESHLFSLTKDGKDQRDYTTAEAAKATSNVNFSPAYASGDKINTYLNFIKDMGPSEVKEGNVGIKEFTISGTSKEPLMIEFEGVGESVVRDPAHAEANALTEASGRFGEYFFLRHATSVKFGTVGGLVERDIFDFSAKVTHGMAEDLFPTGTVNSGLSRSEPCSTGITEVVLEMTINKHDTDDFKTWEQAGTLLQSSLEFTRGLDKLILLFPELRLTAQEIEEEDGSKIKITAKGFKPTGSDPFTTERSISGTEQTLDYSTPFYIMLSNQDSNNYLRVSE